MASILAIVSKKVFDRDFRKGGSPAGLGDVVPTTTYASAHAALAKLADGGDMFLVTVAPGEELWLAGILAQPTFHADRWVSAPSTTPITNITPLIAKLRFANGKGLAAKPGALAMSLQTPRTLTDEDAALLRAAAGGKPVAAPKVVTAKAKVIAAKTTPAAAKAKVVAAKTTPAAAKARVVAAKARVVAAKTTPAAAKARVVAAKTTSVAAKTAKPTPVAAKATSVATKAAPAAAKALATTFVPKSTNHLDRVAEYLAHGALIEALDELLGAWADHKAAEIADLIDALGDRLAQALPPIAGNKTTIDGAWRDVGDQRRPADVPRLLAAFEAGSSKQLEGWLDVLDLFPLDPRLCAAAIDMSVKFVASSAGPTRTRANRLAEKILDGRCLPQIDKLIAKKSDAWNAQELRDRLRKMKAKFAPPPVLAKEDRATVAAIAKTIAKLPPVDAAALVRAPKKTDDDGSRLLAEVLADPAAEGPRLVYMDWLQQREDPRGALMALELQGGNEDAVKRLVKQHGKGWLGPLAAVVSEPVFERGFLTEAVVTIKTAKHRELLQHPLWATVTRVTTTEPAVVESAAMKSLREVTGLEIEDIVALARRPQVLPLAALTGVLLGLDERAPWEAFLAEPGAFANVRTLGVIPHWRAVDQLGTGFADWQWLLAGKLGAQITTLRLDLKWGIPIVGEWLGALDARPRLARLELEGGAPNRVVVTRRGRELAVELRLGSTVKTSALHHVRQAAERLFEGFPVPRAPALDIVITRSQTAAEVARIEAAAREAFAELFATIRVGTR